MKILNHCKHLMKNRERGITFGLYHFFVGKRWKMLGNVCLFVGKDGNELESAGLFVGKRWNSLGFVGKRGGCEKENRFRYINCFGIHLEKVQILGLQ